MVEKTYSYRTSDEDFISYIDDKWDGSFSRFVNSTKKQELNLIKNNKKKNIFDSFSRNVVMLGLGAIFVLFSFNLDDLLSILAVFLMGVFFMISSLVTTFMEVKNIWKNL